MIKLLLMVLLSWFSLVICMNSTENRQSLSDPEENSLYVKFRALYQERTQDLDEYRTIRCYSVYQGLIHMTPSFCSNDEDVKDRLVQMDLCDLDEGVLVLKGFYIEDNLSALTGSVRMIGKK